jgi:antirestriction protein
MLTGNDLLTLVNEMQAQEPPAKMSEIVRACGYEIDGKLKYTQFYTELLDVKGLLPEQPEPADISEEYQEQYQKLCDEYGQDAVDAFLEIYIEEDLDNFEDAYQGRYEDEADFAEQYTNDVYGLDIPSFVIVDWQATWDEGLRDSYEFQDGFVFSNNW